ncbi:MAG: hypothetical protein M1814_004425 [Vezdaea aestivalis]|nr:MAG: hypothetical protein M1814_004425 [Vezdaea aestivalis]
MLPSDDACDEGCSLNLSTIQRRISSSTTSSIAFSSIPFILTFILISTIASRKLYPFLSGQAHLRSHEGRSIPTPTSGRAWRLAMFVFSKTIGTAGVLTVLLLCEISNSLNPAARTIALHLTIRSLLSLLLLFIPALEIYALLRSLGYVFIGPTRSRFHISWLLALASFALYLTAFWHLGSQLPHTHARHGQSVKAKAESLSEACLERIGVVGISLMALLSGFASVSAPATTLFTRARPVSETDISRKQAGLDSTEEMLVAKRSRLRALDKKMTGAPPEGFMTRVMGSIRGNADATERSAILMEISGLETMQLSLSTSVSSLQQRHTTQLRSKTATGRLILTAAHLFALYCLYRIGTTTLSVFRRWLSPKTSFSSDPITSFLALLTAHVDPTLDRAAWSRQIAFFLSGILLLASFSSAAQTISLLSRFMPKLVRAARANSALLVAQIVATYVVSSALLLRSSLPKDVGSVVSEALGAPLELAFVDMWFEGWFLSAVVVTFLGIWVGRRLGGGEWDDDWRDDWDGEGDVEMGKRS